MQDRCREEGGPRSRTEFGEGASRTERGLDAGHRGGGVNPVSPGHGPLSSKSHFSRSSPQQPPSERVLLPACVSAGQVDEWPAAPGGAI